MKILILSPHRDDAVFSLALSITRWVAIGHEVTVMNVFTRSTYAPYASLAGGTEALRVECVSSMRQLEDQAAFKALGVCSVIDLDLDDAPLRLCCETSTVCAMDVRADDAAIPAIRAAVEQWMRDLGNAEHPVALVIPLALGHHVDHCTVRDAAVSISTSVPCAFYEDLPYAMREGVHSDLSCFRENFKERFQEDLSPVLSCGTPIDPGAFKRSISLLYKSQIDRAAADSMGNFSQHYGGAERMWVNRSWLLAATGGNLSRPIRLSAEQFAR